MTKRISVILPEEVFENLRARSFTDNDGGVSVTIRNIVMEVLAKEDKMAQKLMEAPIEKQPFKSLKKSASEISMVQGVIKKNAVIGSGVRNQPIKVGGSSDSSQHVSDGLNRPAGELDSDSYV